MWAEHQPNMCESMGCRHPQVSSVQIHRHTGTMVISITPSDSSVSPKGRDHAGAQSVPNSCLQMNKVSEVTERANQKSRRYLL